MRLKGLLIAFVVLLSACSSTPPLNVDNDFWFGTLTRTGSAGAFAGFGFRQSGRDIEVALAISNGTQTQACCVLTGSLNGRALEASFVDAANDSVIVSGTFSDNGRDFTGTLRFVIEGANEDYSLQMSYQKELDAALMVSFALEPAILKSTKGLLE